MAALAITAAVLATLPLRSAAQLPTGFRDTVAIQGLEAPTVVQFSRDGRVFVAEKSGIVKVFDDLADPSGAVFADLRAEVHNFLDRGLLGMALDPDFPTRPYLYVLYTRDADVGAAAPKYGRAGVSDDPCPNETTQGCTVSGRLARLEARGNAIAGPPLALVDGWFQQFPSHSVGTIAFGPDNALYASGGEGAHWATTTAGHPDYGQYGNPGGDPPVPVGGTQTPPTAEGGSLRAQDLRTPSDPVGLSGTVIRVHRDTGAALPDNPLAGHADVNARRIVAYGLRNPFRIAARPGTGELWIGDVGWRLDDEINRLIDPAAAVRNFGWPCYEGNGRNPVWDSMNVTLCENLYGDAGAVAAPFFRYRQGTAVVAGEACGTIDSALSGLAFYQGGSYPAEYDGALFFADYARRCIWVMPRGTGGDPDPARRATFVAGAANPVDLQIGPGGDLFYVDIAGGAVHRISFSGAPTAIVSASPQSGSAPLAVAFDARQSSDPEGGPLAFTWDLDGDGSFGDATVPSFTHTYTVDGTYTVRVRVTDQTGQSATASVAIVVGNRAPAPAIDAPAPTLKWVVGQTVDFAGHATDPEDGALPASALRWSLIIHHCATPTSCHEHFIQNFVGVASGSFTAPDHEMPSYLELRLTATDSGGLTGVTSVRLDRQGSSAGDVVKYASRAPVKAGTWRVVADPTAAGGARLEHPDAGAPKLAAPLANPADYFEVTADVEAGRPYRLWLRGRADRDAWANDSVFVQFSGSVDAAGAPANRIGTTQALIVAVEDCTGCGLSGWGWQDNGYGVNVLGPPVYFAAAGPQTIRIQGREDGVSLDQVVLSPSTYLNAPPGATRNDTVILPETGAPVPPPPGDVVRWASRATAVQGTWRLVADPSAAGGNRLEHPDAGAAKINAPLASPRDYFEVSVHVEAGRGYRLWLRGRALGDHWANDSVYVQFSGSVDPSGTPINRIGTTQALPVVIEDCSGCGLAGWGWQDNGYGAGVLGPLVYFAADGAQTVRIQGREDGISIDQIVLSPSTYLTDPPGPAKADATILPESGAGGPPPPGAGEVVRYASSAPVRHGAWRVVADASAAGGARLEHPDAGVPKLAAPLAAPEHYFELVFDAEAGRPYRLWLRGRAHGDHWANDSVFVQFSGSVDAGGAAQHRIGTTQALIVTVEECTGCGVAGWGWQDHGYGVNVLGPAISFAVSGPQTIRIQGREDGVSIDQVVLSPAAYLNAPPGATKHDTTILPQTP